MEHFLLRRKRYSKECPICYEDKELYEFDCGDMEHCFCLECYKKIDKCPSCQVPKNQYYVDLFKEGKQLIQLEINYPWSNMSSFDKKLEIVIGIGSLIMLYYVKEIFPIKAHN